jgi:PAS domain S-box-containing protein
MSSERDLTGPGAPRKDAAGDRAPSPARPTDALDRAESMLRSLVDATTDAVYVKDLDGRYLLFNAAAAAITGKSPAEVIGRDDTFLFPPDEARAVMAGDRAVVEGGQPNTYEESVTAADGTVRHFLSTKGPLFDQQGRPYGLFGIARDITDRKTAEIDLGRMTARYEAILAADPDIIAEVDKDKVYTWVNDAGRLFFGDDVVGNEAARYFLGDQETYERVQPLFAGSADTIYVESWQRRADGERRLLGWWCRMITDESGRPAGALSTARDITDQKAAEVELRGYRSHLEALVLERTSELDAANEELASQNEELVSLNEELDGTNADLVRTSAELERADRAKSEFLAGMSHELRTPLNSIIGFTGVMRQGLAGPLTEEQQRQLAMISDSGIHLLSLVNDVLDLARIEAGRLELTLQDIDVEELAHQAVETVRPLAEQRGLRLSVGVEPCCDVLRSDARSLNQILLNLLGNAVKFTEAGEVSLSVRCRDDELMFDVADTGIGIAPDRVDKVFDEFKQYDQPGFAKPEGTGLGLPVSRRLAERLCGRIDLRSKVGEGSVFTLVVPRMGEPGQG